jgi:hypothetical protein
VPSGLMQNPRRRRHTGRWLSHRRFVRAVRPVTTISGHPLRSPLFECEWCSYGNTHRTDHDRLHSAGTERTRVDVRRDRGSDNQQTNVGHYVGHRSGSGAWYLSHDGVRSGPRWFASFDQAPPTYRDSPSVGDRPTQRTNLAGAKVIGALTRRTIRCFHRKLPMSYLPALLAQA